MTVVNPKLHSRTRKNKLYLEMCVPSHPYLSKDDDNEYYCCVEPDISCVPIPELATGWSARIIDLTFL